MRQCLLYVATVFTKPKSPTSQKTTTWDGIKYNATQSNGGWGGRGERERERAQIASLCLVKDEH